MCNCTWSRPLLPPSGPRRSLREMFGMIGDGRTRRILLDRALWWFCLSMFEAALVIVGITLARDHWQ